MSRQLKWFAVELLAAGVLFGMTHYVNAVEPTPPPLTADESTTLDSAYDSGYIVVLKELQTTYAKDLSKASLDLVAKTFKADSEHLAENFQHITKGYVPDETVQIACKIVFLQGQSDAYTSVLDLFKTELSDKSKAAIQARIVDLNTQTLKVLTDNGLIPTPPTTVK